MNLDSRQYCTALIFRCAADLARCLRPNVAASHDKGEASHEHPKNYAFHSGFPPRYSSAARFNLLKIIASLTDDWGLSNLKSSEKWYASTGPARPAHRSIG